MSERYYAVREEFWEAAAVDGLSLEEAEERARDSARATGDVWLVIKRKPVSRFKSPPRTVDVEQL